MLVVALERRVQFIVLFCVVSMTLVVTPWMNLDAINLPKFLILVVSGFALFGNLAPYGKKMFSSENRLLVIFAFVFVLGLLLSFLVGGSGNLSQVYGVYGRNTGLLSYLSMVIVMLSVVFVSKPRFAKKLLWALIATGTVNAVYGLVQWVDLDPINWRSLDNPITGTLGNSNFTSAHLGIAGSASIALLLNRGTSLVLKLVLFLNIGLSVFVIFQSDSSQGLLIFTLGSIVVLYFRFVDGLKISLVKYLYWGIVFMLGLVGVFGILKRGPLASVLYQETVTYRGDYWRAGLKMTLDHPFFGVGLDSYGDWYRFSRTEVAALRRGPDVTTNSAHNVFLDISSNGGLFLLIAYLSIIGVVIRSALRVLRRSGGFDAVGVGLVSSWLAYLAQSVISINQLGLAIWGWVLGGGIIGYDLYKDQSDVARAKHSVGKHREQVPPSIMLSSTFGLVIGFLVSIWPVTQDISFRDALESGDAVKIESATDNFPRNSFYYIYAANILQESKISDRALDLIRLAIASNPRDFNAWKLLAANPKASESEQDFARAKMRELDPFNNTLGD